MSDEEDGKTGDAALFAIFLFSVLALGIVPMTIWRISTGGGGKANVVQPWQKKTSRTPFADRLRPYLNKINFALLVGWLVLLALGIYISTCTLKEEEPFNPFTILGISETVELKEIKRAYRALSKLYHPDKNPDPEAAKFFVEKVAKAYQTLTDDGAREKWKKYGHPDGPQSMIIQVALPDWFFPSDKKFAPLVLLGLAFLGLAAPILAVSLYLWCSEGYVGANKISERTFLYYQKYGVKEMLRLPKIPEALVPSQEFVEIPFTRDQARAFQQFHATMKREYEAVASCPKWWASSPQIVRTFMFVVAYLDRREDLVPPEFKQDYLATLRLLPIMSEEFVKASVLPRNRMMRGWFMPAEAAVQFQQCAVQQIRLDVRCPNAEEKKKKKNTVGEGAAALLQLPGVEIDTLKELEKGHRVKCVQDLAKLPEARRKEVLGGCGVPASAVADIDKTLSTLPHIHITAVKVFVDGEEDIKEGDMITIQIFVVLTRACHAHASMLPLLGCAAAQAHTPRFPHVVKEKWHAFLSNQKVQTPSTWGYRLVELIEAESAGIDNYDALGCRWAPQASGPTASGTSADSSSTAVHQNGSAPTGCKGEGGAEGEAASSEEIGQKIEFKFMLHEPGRFNLTFVLMPSCWIGCDASEPVSLNVLRQTLEEKSGKVQRRGGHGKPVALDGSDDDDDEDDSDEESDEDGDSEGWDTDETGTDVTHSDDSEDKQPAKDGKGKKEGKPKESKKSE